MNQILTLIDKETGKKIAQYNLSELTVDMDPRFLRKEVTAIVEVEKDEK